MERGAPTEARVEEGRAEEGWADDERPVGAVASDPTDIELRADIARYLERVIFPAARDRLVDDAVSRQAPTAVISALERLPSERVFENVEQIWEALGGRPEHRF